ncbi:MULTISPECIES: hypothetical protein [unclassified Nocardioides]|uniref:hypothetical protein n=1 Tax=unclassified Nocardioides TaxID=2615069 RepID=UPI00138F363C|nr:MULTISPECIES: hypothetical protein [unclassified Nocardioides]
MQDDDVAPESADAEPPVPVVVKLTRDAATAKATTNMQIFFTGWVSKLAHVRMALSAK